MTSPCDDDPRLLGVGLTPAEVALLDCSPVVSHAPTYARLFDLGISGWSVTGGSPFNALHAEAVCAFGDRFEFASAMRDTSEAQIVVIIPARDQSGATTDLIAWDLDNDSLATWRGGAPLLGEESIDALQLDDDGGGGIRVFAGAAEWLKANRQGVVIIDPDRARWILAGRTLIALTTDFGVKLDAAMRLPKPGILVNLEAAT